MSYFYIEVKHTGKKLSEGKVAKILGLHDSTSKIKPVPAYGGDALIPCSELAYKCLSASRGSTSKIKAMLENLEWLEGEEY